MNQQNGQRPVIEVDRHISLQDAQRLIQGQALLSVSSATRERCRAAEARLARCIQENRHVYGLTTGFGPLANRLVSNDHGITLQQNLIHHLASGVGPSLSWGAARALVLARLMSILQAVSGASGEAIGALEAVLASDLAPVVPARGTVGASGDLTPLAHMALCLQGRGAFLSRDGTRIDAAPALQAMGLRPLSLAQRDGLALVNGTSAMTGIAVLNAGQAKRQMKWATALTALYGEGMRARTEAWHAGLSRARPHPGQRRVAGDLMAMTAGSTLVRRTLTAIRVLEPRDVNSEEAEPGQDAYTLRCAPQVIGAAWDTLDWHDSVVERELNAATDNPIFPDTEETPALHGGNFMGTHVALVSDALSAALLVLAGLAERQVARITDERLNRGLPPFLHQGQAGLNSGFMGAQVTATALLAEMRAVTGLASAQSLSTNGANQDVVSMGTISARMAGERLNDLARIQAILALCAVQAVELRMAAGAGVRSPYARDLSAQIRRISPPLTDDRPLGAEIEALADAIANKSPPRLADGS
ncbi:MAG: aromatic amino acid ammonia-lyase [Pseudomonadota bacterium]